MTEPKEPAAANPPPAVSAPAEAQAIIDARALFQGRREIVIEHEGARYRLRITRRNKLILQK